MSRRRLTDEKCIAVVQEYQDGKGGYSAIGEKYVSANQTSGQKIEPRSISAQIPYLVHNNHNELQ